LAGILDGAVAGTRPTCEKGWIHPRLQVGLTGEKVAPRLYIAVGVSGAVQHVAGIIGSKVIAAINKTPEANIFKEADFGAIGDYREILPSFIEEIRRHLSKGQI
jgi:electron transfer flavoprotein alpha subunit